MDTVFSQLAWRRAWALADAHGHVWAAALGLAASVEASQAAREAELAESRARLVAREAELAELVAREAAAREAWAAARDAWAEVYAARSPTEACGAAHNKARAAALALRDAVADARDAVADARDAVAEATRVARAPAVVAASAALDETIAAARASRDDASREAVDEATADYDAACRAAGLDGAYEAVALLRATVATVARWLPPAEGATVSVVAALAATWGDPAWPFEAPFEYDGRLLHSTGTGRLGWTVRVDGRVDLAVYRPGSSGVVVALRAVVPAAGAGGAWSTGQTPAAPRHARALSLALRALGVEPGAVRGGVELAALADSFDPAVDVTEAA